MNTQNGRDAPFNGSFFTFFLSIYIQIAWKNCYSSGRKADVSVIKPQDPVMLPISFCQNLRVISSIVPVINLIKIVKVDLFVT